MKNAPRNFPEQKIDVFKIYFFFYCDDTQFKNG